MRIYKKFNMQLQLYCGSVKILWMAVYMALGTSGWNKVRWSLAQRGLIGTLQVVARRATQHASKPVAQHPFDLEHGVDTSGLIGGGDLRAGHAHDVYITGYYGMAPSRFTGSIDRWMETPPLNPMESYSFIDLGCGKGRAVMLASRLRFRETIGVELNRELVEIAKGNAETWKAAGRALCPMRIEEGDATEFELPDGPCLIYMANPFGAPVMQCLLDKLKIQTAVGTRRLDVLYQNPEQEAVFQRNPAFQLLWSENIPMSQKDEAATFIYKQTDKCNAYRLVDS